MKKELNANEKTKKLVVTAMMIAIVEILSFTPIGMIVIPPISATTAHIPVIMTAILEGPIAGLFVALALGITSIIRAMSSPNFLDLLFLNPLVSVFPRLLIPLTTYFSYILLKKVLGGLFSNGNIVAYFLAAAIGSMTNTIGCMGMLYIIYAKEILQNLGQAAEVFVIGIITTYGVLEMLVAATITVLVVPVLKKVFYK